MNSKDEKIPVYPVIFVTRKGNNLDMETYLRKKHTDGKYYFVKFKRNALCQDGKTDLTNEFTSFNRDIYKAQLYYDMDIDMAYSSGKKLHPVDEDQTDEKERMANII